MGSSNRMIYRKHWKSLVHLPRVYPYRYYTVCYIFSSIGIATRKYGHWVETSIPGSLEDMAIILHGMKMVSPSKLFFILLNIIPSCQIPN